MSPPRRRLPPAFLPQPPSDLLTHKDKSPTLLSFKSSRVGGFLKDFSQFRARDFGALGARIDSSARTRDFWCVTLSSDGSGCAENCALARFAVGMLGRLEEKHKGRRVGDGNSEDDGRRREIRDIRAETYRWSDDSSSPHNSDSRNLEVSEQRRAVSDTREEEDLPPPPPGPPPKLVADAQHNSRLSSGQARSKGELERLRGEGHNSDGDSESDGRGHGRRSKDPRRYGGSSSDDDDHRRENQDRKRERNHRPDKCSSPPPRKQKREDLDDARCFW